MSSLYECVRAAQTARRLTVELFPHQQFDVAATRRYRPGARPFAENVASGESTAGAQGEQRLLELLRQVVPR